LSVFEGRNEAVLEEEGVVLGSGGEAVFDGHFLKSKAVSCHVIEEREHIGVLR
jgi:hypothetical protein